MKITNYTDCSIEELESLKIVMKLEMQKITNDLLDIDNLLNQKYDENKLENNYEIIFI